MPPLPARLAGSVAAAVLLVLTPAYPVRGAVHPATTHFPAWTAALPSAALLPGYHVHYQEHISSCEAAALSMSTQGRLTEAMILARMPYNPDPWLGFRGSIDRRMNLAAGLPDYGIYAPALAKAAQAYGYQTRVFSGPHAVALLEYSISRLHAAPEVWITLGMKRWPAVIGHANGRSFLLVEYEHAATVIGYDDDGVAMLDPEAGLRYYSWARFLSVWQGLFDGMSLLAAPRFGLPPLISNGAHREGALGVWSWHGAVPGDSVQVTLFGLRKHTRYPIATRTLTAQANGTFSVRFRLQPGASYAVATREVGPLDVSSPVQIPASTITVPPAPAPFPRLTATPTETVVPARTPIPTPTKTLRPTMSPTPVPQPTGTLTPGPASTPTMTATPDPGVSPLPTATPIWP